MFGALEGDAWCEFLEMAPSGFRFTPTDTELMCDYLMKTANSLPLPFPMLKVIEFFELNPEVMAGMPDSLEVQQ